MKITKSHYHEVTDRISIINMNIYEYVTQHPAIKKSKKYTKLAVKAEESLAKLYQLTGGKM